jgi:hypothetical protein
MNKIIKIISFFMAATMSFFSPLSIIHGDSGCCAECALKKEEEVEVVYEEKEDIGGGNDD